MTEVWRPVPGYHGFYEVSDLGRFRRSAKGRGAQPGRLLSTRRRSAKGYVVVELCVGDHKHRFLGHRLVARAFLDAPRGRARHVNHLDGVKTNNAVGNLEWTTEAANTAHAIRLGLQRPRRGEQNGRAKLTSQQVREIREMKGCLGQRHIARRFGVARSMIQRIHQGRAWASEWPEWARVREWPEVHA